MSEIVALDVDPRRSTVAPIRASGSPPKGDDLREDLIMDEFFRRPRISVLRI